MTLRRFRIDRLSGVFAALEGVGAGQAALPDDQRIDMCNAGHVHDPAATATPVPYDPTKPIDLSGTPGVTPEQQAAAENLVAITVVRLPQWADYRDAEAAGFHSIGDGLTGFEHFINWDWINDGVTLDPDHPESLVYQPQPDGSKKLVSAMYMLPDTVSLTEVPELGGALTQSELARRLTADGYPVQQSHISRMQDAIRYLLPAIPTVLYGGLGRHQVERLAVLRRACERTWEQRALGRHLAVDFASLFQDVLSQFDTQPDGFSLQRVQDELVGQMAELLEADYDTLSLEIDDCENRQRVLTSEPSPTTPLAPIVSAAPQPVSPPPAAATAQRAGAPTAPIAAMPSAQPVTVPAAGDEREDRCQRGKTAEITGSNAHGMPPFEDGP